jgi:hypothetical protein
MVLLTGATGLVGMEVLARYLERSDRKVCRSSRRSSSCARTASASRSRCSARASLWASGEETYHLVAGQQASTVGRLMEISARYFRRRPPWLVPPALYRRLLHPLLVRTSRGRRRRALRSSEVYFPYFDTRARYDDRRARARLDRAGIRATPVERYFDQIAGFAVGSRWGRVAISRWQAERRGAPHGGAR